MTNNQYDEYVRCKEDKTYFIENYMKVYTLDEGIIPLIPNEFQNHVIKDLDSERYIIKYADRREGKTITAVALLLHMICFEHNRTGIIIGVRNDAAAEILRLILCSWNELPEWMKPKIIKQNKAVLVFDNGIQIMSFGASSDGWRGLGIAFLYIDEFEFFQARDFIRIRDCLIPCVLSGNSTRILMLSS